MSVTSNMSSKPGGARPSALACVECRKRHLKCDAALPNCSRCLTAGIECVFTPSRRGYRGPSKRKCDAQHEGSQRPTPSFERRTSDTPDQAEQWRLLSASKDAVPTVHDSYAFLETAAHDCLAGSHTAFDETGALPSQQQQQKQLPISFFDSSEELNQESDDPQLTNLYYSNFHAAHPILVPRAWYNEQHYPKYLTSVVQFIGSHFSTSVSSDSLRNAVGKKLASADAHTSTMVQALLLFSIALHSRNEAKEAQENLARAVDLALELGMNRSCFAVLNGHQQPIVEESIRRTWWELFIVDGYMAALHRKTGFKSSQVDMGIALPCEETIFTEGICPPNPPTLAQFDGRLFADEEIQFSSFCYRIEAVRILSRVLAIAGADEVHEDQIQAVDNALAGWVHHLPATKADIVNNFGEVDEMLFQAHMIIQCSNIFLHFPRSELLATLPGTAEIVCAGGGKQMCPATTLHMHAVKATDASKELSNLAALRVPVQKHTPFFVCGLVLSAIVQLSACSVHACHCMEQHRDRVALIIGILKSLSQHWTIASTVLQQVKKVGAEVLQVRSTSRPNDIVVPESSRDSGVDVSTGIEDISWLDLFDSQGLTGFATFDASASYAQHAP